MVFIFLPGSERTGINRLSRLPDAGGCDLPLGFEEFETGGIPVKTEMGNKRPALALQIRNEVLIDNVMNFQGQDLLPMRHELFVTSVSQEHGHVRVRDKSDYARFPVGSQLRVLPIHACMTAAAYDYFNLLENDQVSDRWDRVNGW